ncbi:hypothetical protein [Leifsonia sp. EB34]|uniref:hypothetical protein n=1 Tax=Leifsonia sp. EB34 TaxID=3156303 RepID=UPI003510E0CB
MPGRFDLKTTTVGQLLDDLEARKVIDDAVPEIANHPMIGLARGLTFDFLAGMAGSQVPASTISDLRERLSAL